MNRAPLRRGGARRLALAIAVPAVASLALAGCTGSDEPETADQTPEDVLSEAKSLLDETSGITVRMSTPDDPGTDYLSEATGTIVADPASFEGKISGRVAGFPGSDIGVVSIDGSVYIDVPLQGWTDQYQPADFCAPDPATLLDPDSGVSSLLTAADDVEAGESQRSEDDASVVITPTPAPCPATRCGRCCPAPPRRTSRPPSRWTATATCAPWR
ncbi:LppX_LprAFG lipoprotein [Nocardioides sambongensis]|uniref:LppX_LprAFG lipoprotein n=1 Tax=Nocardioides sambongensis TaxID=2589074 RepID=UPI0015E85DD8|nr:LppX_LprAFG lipoprotein [Nocardioides sambongensis]